MAFLLLFFLAFGMTGLFAQDTPNTPNLFPNDLDDAKTYSERANPWGATDAAGNLRCLSASQLAVDDNGATHPLPFSPSVAVGDLNGDGLLDLVIADAEGFFWYFPNSGTKTEPKFTTGEIMPVWIGDPLEPPGVQTTGAVRHMVPRIQLVDIGGSGKLDLVAGNFTGELFYIPNLGSSSQPKFVTPIDLHELKSIPTRKDRMLTCNYFSPFLYDWFGDGHLHLIRGDGTYSANSIYLFLNKGTNEQPVFNEDNQIKIIPGMGREDLTPQVIDWNGDGKPDIITGERIGVVEVFLNTSQDPANPTFDQGQALAFGGQNKFGHFTTVTTGALTGNPKTPDVIISNDSGLILLARNTGTPGAPKFATPPQPLKATNPYPKVLISSTWCMGGPNVDPQQPSYNGWSVGTPDGVPYELLSIANAQSEPGFAPPDGVKWKNALHYQLLSHKSTYFSTTYYPRDEDLQPHSINQGTKIYLTSDVRYRISFWVKGDGISDLKYSFYRGREQDPKGGGSYKDALMSNAINLSGSWSQVTDDISWRSAYDQKNVNLDFWFSFAFTGQGNLYVADVQVHKLE